MPRQNGASNSPSLEQRKQAQLDEELAETGHHDALEELGDAPPNINSDRVSPTKSAMGEEFPRRGVLGRVLGLFSRKAVLGEPQDVLPVEEGEEVELNEIPIHEANSQPAPDSLTPRAQPAAGIPTTLKSPSRASGSLANPAKRKRASDAERRDLYDVPIEATQEDSEPEEAPTSRPAKRTRRNGRAKAPLTIPKTSRGYNRSHQTRQPRGKYAVEVEDEEVAADAPAPSPIDGDRVRNPVEVEQPKPRKRGRPPKIKNPPSEVVKDTAMPNETEPNSHAVVKGVATGNHPGIALQAPGDIDEGVSEILLNASPVKVLREEVRLVAHTAQQQKLSRPKRPLATENGMSELSADEEEPFVNNGRAEERLDVPEEMEGEEEQEAADRSSNKPRWTPFDPKLIDKMWETSKHVGHKFDVEEKTWSKDRKIEKLWTGPGKRMARQLTTIISAYENLQQSKASRDKRAFRDAHEEVEKVLNLLSEETKTVLSERFGPDSDPKKAEAMLTDFYFNIIPKCIHALKKVVAVYDNQGSMETPALKEILKSVDVLHDLANTAVSQPKEIQPRTKGSVSYQISQPTRYNLPDIRNLQKMIMAELRFREREKERAEEELLRPERERQLAEDQKREDAELRRKREERRRLQGESWWAVRNNYITGHWNRMLQSDIAKLKAARKGKGREESVELGYPRANRAESRRANSEESRHGVERVSVFPGNNVKASSSLSSLSKEDTLIFIDCMRYEQGADRYERAAEQIGRSMDEVFAFAKEFQEAMDLQHQEGNFNEVRDSWTYSVWVEQE